MPPENQRPTPNRRPQHRLTSDIVWVCEISKDLLKSALPKASALSGYSSKSPSTTSLHRTRKTVSLKPVADKMRSGQPIVRKASLHKSVGVLRSSSPKTVSVKSRLSMSRKISYAVGPPLNSSKGGAKSRDTVSSVFQRLGFND